MAHFLPPEHVRQVNKLEWPHHNMQVTIFSLDMAETVLMIKNPNSGRGEMQANLTI